MTTVFVLKMTRPYGQGKSHGGGLAVSVVNQSELFLIQMPADEREGTAGRL